MAVGCVSALAALVNAILLPETLQRHQNTVQPAAHGASNRDPVKYDDDDVDSDDEDAPMLGVGAKRSGVGHTAQSGDGGWHAASQTEWTAFLQPRDAGHVQLSTEVPSPKPEKGDDEIDSLMMPPKDERDDDLADQPPATIQDHSDNQEKPKASLIDIDPEEEQHQAPPPRRLLSRRNLSTQGLYTIHHRHAPGTSDFGPWYRHRPVCFALASYTLVAFLHRLSDELVPLFAAAPVSTGGLGWTAAALAPSLSFGGLVLMVFALIGYPAVQRRLGVKKCARLGLLATFPAGFLFPAAALLQVHAQQQVFFFLAAAARAMVGIMAFTSTIVAVNLCAPRNEMGVVNGVGQALAAGMRAAAPACAGMLWSATMSFPGVRARGLVAFSVVGVVALVARVVCGQVELLEDKERGT